MPGSSQPPRLRARERGRARRRLRYLRQVRELALRDAGGFLFDLYRFGVQRDALVRAKLEALITTDREIRSLEGQLGVAGRAGEIRQPGVGGRCGSCGAFHSSESKFCARCGVELATVALAAPGPVEGPPVEEPVEPAVAEPVAETIEEEPGEDDAGAEDEPAEVETFEDEDGEEDTGVEELGEEEVIEEGVDGEVTVIRQTGTGDPVAEEAAPSNGAVPEHLASANGETPAQESAPADPDTGEVAPVGGSDRSRTRRSRARRRRGADR